MSKLSNKQIQNKAIRAYLNDKIDTSIWADQISSINMIETLSHILTGVRDFESPFKMQNYCSKFILLYIKSFGDQITVSLKEAVGSKIMHDSMEHPRGNEIFGRIMEELGPLPSCGCYDKDETKRIVKEVLCDSEE